MPCVEGGRGALMEREIGVAMGFEVVVAKGVYGVWLIVGYACDGGEGTRIEGDNNEGLWVFLCVYIIPVWRRWRVRSRQHRRYRDRGFFCLCTWLGT